MQFAQSSPSQSSSPSVGPFPSMGNMNFGSSTPSEQAMGNNFAKIGNAFSNSFSGAAGNSGIAPMMSQPQSQSTPIATPARPDVGPFPAMGNLNAPGSGGSAGYTDLMNLLSRFGRR